MSLRAVSVFLPSCGELSTALKLIGAAYLWLGLRTFLSARRAPTVLNGGSAEHKQSDGIARRKSRQLHIEVPGRDATSCRAQSTISERTS